MNFSLKTASFFSLKHFWPLALCVLAGCSAIYGESFDCPAGTGTKCKSISEVNTLVDRGEIGRQESTPSSLQQEFPEKPPSVNSESLPLFNRVSSSVSPPAVIRRPEQTLRVWLAPHTDESGVYVSERYVYMVVAPGTWAENKGSSSSANNLSQGKRP